MDAKRTDSAGFRRLYSACSFRWPVLNLVCLISTLIVLIGSANSLAQTPAASEDNCSVVTESAKSYSSVPSRSATKIPTHHFEIIARYPHDQEAFTQGLVIYENALYESTGIRGRSSIRRLDLESGRVVMERSLSRTLFGEGLAVLNAQIVQLTWQSGTAFTYAPDNLQQTGSFTYQGEGWGSASIEERLVISDGSSWLRFLDADHYRQTNSLQVTDNGRPLEGLNELEIVDGLIYANVYPSDCIAQIDPQSGRVVGWIDLGGLMPESERPHRSAVANGIAYNAGTGDLFVTGKLWPYIYKLKLKTTEVLPDKQHVEPESTRRGTITTMLNGGS